MSAIKTIVVRIAAAFALVAVVACQVSCNKSEKPAEPQTQAGPRTFATPDDAAKAVVDAAKSDN